MTNMLLWLFCWTHINALLSAANSQCATAERRIDCCVDAAKYLPLFPNYIDNMIKLFNDDLLSLAVQISIAENSTAPIVNKLIDRLGKDQDVDFHIALTLEHAARNVALPTVRLRHKLASLSGRAAGVITYLYYSTIEAKCIDYAMLYTNTIIHTDDHVVSASLQVISENHYECTYLMLRNIALLNNAHDWLIQSACLERLAKYGKRSGNAVHKAIELLSSSIDIVVISACDYLATVGPDAKIANKQLGELIRHRTGLVKSSAQLALDAISERKMK